MFCDIYSLGRGEVSSREQFCCFTINHLQVLRGYRYEKVPESVRAVACGGLGLWKPGEPEPKLEIVHHHVAPVVWPKLPDRWRVQSLQDSGTARVMVPVTNPLERAMYPPGVDAYTLAMNPAPSADPDPSLEELLPGLVDQVRSPELAGGPSMDVIKERVRELTEPDLAPRPPQTSRVPRRAVTVAQDVVAAAVEAASGRCQGETGAGASCPRKARPGAVYCGAHDIKAVV